MPSITVEPCTFALFGALGDLALRKLFPALYQLDRAGLLHADTRILALAREPGDALTHLAHIDSQLRQYVGAKEIEDKALARFLARLSYLHVDFLQEEDYLPLAELAGTEQRLIAYFATPAAVYGAITGAEAPSPKKWICRAWINKSTARLIRFGSSAWQAVSSDAIALPKIFCV